jgi:hypothetical protein
MRHLALALCLLAATACSKNSPTGPSVPLDERFTLGVGEVAVLEDADTRLQFVGVSGDSRCPADAFCIQGGDAIVHVRLADARGAAEYELHTGDSSQAAAEHRGLRVALVELQPYPFSSRQLSPEEYEATLTVTRR